MAFYRRSELQGVAQSKLDDAILLLEHKRYSNAYYLAGYAVEVGLKACIAKQITADVIPDRRFISDTHVHELRKLIGVAGLATELKKQEGDDPQFAVNWALVAQWDPEVRYSGVDSSSAQYLIEAVADDNSGVFRWIKALW